MRLHWTRAIRLWACTLALLLIAGCNAVFDISHGTPRPLCADPLLIDDLEDGDGSICPTNGRSGGWFAVGDDTLSAELTPSSDVFGPSLIEEGPRGNSRYAIRLRGSGFTAWGAVFGVGFGASSAPGVAATPSSYDASAVNGIRFWMRSTTPVTVNIPTTETIPIGSGGECVDAADEDNCYNDFGFSITAPSRDWVQYEVPFNALGQRPGGSALWNPRHVMNVQFNVPANVEFDVSIDDLSFYNCANCQPTCTDPDLPLSCRQGDGIRSSCQPLGTDCVEAARYPVLEGPGGGDPACIGNPPDQPARCGLFDSAGVPFATEVHPFTDGVSNARLRNPEPGKVCIQGAMVEGGTAAISCVVTKIESDVAPYAIVPFDLQALDITTLEFTLTNAPTGGVSLELLAVVKPECSSDFDCVGPPLSLGGSNPTVFEDGTWRVEMADFELADPRLVWTFHFSGHSIMPANYDFCLEAVKFLDSRGELVSPPAAG